MIDERERFEEAFDLFERPEPAWERLVNRRDRKRRNQRITAGLVGIAAAVAVVAIGWIVGTSARPDATTPATQPTKAPAVEVAWQFLHQLAAFNQDQAVSYLADDADLSGMGLKGPREFRSILSWQQATGFKWIPTSCEETHRTLADGTWVTCGFDFHALRSDQIGKGPYSSSYINLAVKDGEIVRMSGYLEHREFWHQMWLPFGAWVTSNYPEDVAAMYKPSNLQPLSNYRLTPESIRLWERHTRQYVKAVRQATA